MSRPRWCHGLGLDCREGERWPWLLIGPRWCHGLDLGLDCRGKMALTADWLIFVCVTDGIGCQGHRVVMALALTAGRGKDGLGC